MLLQKTTNKKIKQQASGKQSPLRGQAWFQLQNIITNNTKCTSSILQYKQTFFVFYHIVGMPDQDVTSLYNSYCLYTHDEPKESRQ